MYDKCLFRHHDFSFWGGAAGAEEGLQPGHLPLSTLHFESRRLVPYPRASSNVALYTRNARSLPHLCSTSGAAG